MILWDYDNISIKEMLTESIITIIGVVLGFLIITPLFCYLLKFLIWYTSLFIGAV